jgi:hypothetical protein
LFTAGTTKWFILGYNYLFAVFTAVVTGGFYGGGSTDKINFALKKMPATGSIQRLAERYIIALFFFTGIYFKHSHGRLFTSPGKRDKKQAIAAMV